MATSRTETAIRNIGKFLDRLHNIPVQKKFSLRGKTGDFYKNH